MKESFLKIFIVLACVVSAGGYAASQQVFHLWESVNPPTENGLDPARENAQNPDWIMGVGDPTVTIYPAENPNGTLLLMCPGGAYFGLAGKHEGSDLAVPLNEKGVSLAVLKYRLPNGHKEVPADDVWRAYDIIKEHAGEYGVDVNKIGIGGASAGGHLASTVATHPREGRRFAFQVLIYPVISMKDGLTHGGSRDNLLGKTPDVADKEYYSNEQHVSGDSPKAFMVLSADDDVVPMENSIRYYEALKAHKVPVYLHVYPSGGHGWLCRDNFKYNSQVVEELAEWTGRL